MQELFAHQVTLPRPSEVSPESGTPEVGVDIRSWYAEAPNNVLAGVELHGIDPQAIATHGRSRTFTRPDGRLLQLSTDLEPINGLMEADWLACDGITHHASVLVDTGMGHLARFVARGEGTSRVYRQAPLADGWYAFGIDQHGRLLIAGAAASTPNRSGTTHRQLVAGLPGLFFGEISVVGGHAVAFNHHAKLYGMAAAAPTAVMELVPALRAARFVP